MQHKELKVKLKNSLLGLAIGLSAFSSQAAYVTYTGFDLGIGEGTPLATTPNSTGAETSFKNALIGVGTETFEGIATGTGGPLAVNFGAAGTATLSGGGGSVESVTPGFTNGFGRYSIPSASSSKFWEVAAGSSGDFSILFSETIAAFGFYGVDIGDFSGTLNLEIYNGASLLSSQLVSGTRVTGGSVLYFGIIASDVTEDFTEVRFRTTGGSGDVFAFDNFTIGNREQICRVNCGGEVPEPGSLALLGLGIAGLAAASRRRKAV
ncbi:PEP-CTERM sorting domain-containing protein [Hydrogenophaga sp.]|uniref:PEP-CTERM sorting domain-containing protein n=1 Tax=Hydrogenophaga sp. TaxID=1904254 RepID=UPI002736721A|nr:PEP-CTERM sorting domain-containing protein [Hydrogenophaga sp.]